jgi:hypothetical protein
MTCVGSDTTSPDNIIGEQFPQEKKIME